MGLESINKIRENIKKVIIGNDETIDYVLTALLVGGHVLLEDVPGTGKTMLAKSLAASINLSFNRIQFTPDLLPSDITGLYYFDKKEDAFIFRPGPLFAQIILGDEINRATPRTQSALLECMAEGQVTIEGTTHKLSDPFFVIATQNPIESSGTFPLPEAQLDRFIMCLSMEKPDRAGQLEILKRFDSDSPLKSLESVATKEDLLAARAEIKNIHIDDSLSEYILKIVEETAKQPEVLNGASTRASLDLYHSAKAYAYLKGRGYVVPEDIKALAPVVISHRLLLSRGSKWQQVKATEIINRILSSVDLNLENWK